MKTIEDIVNESGYPLQIHLEKLIKDTYGINHMWKVSVSEHRWINRNTGDEGFIDLILEHLNSLIKLVIECKRIEGKWIFLLPTMNPRTIYKTRLLHADFRNKNILWKEGDFGPESYEAEYCVLETEGKKDNRTLEKLTSDLLLSLEYLALEEAEFYKPTAGQNNNQNPYIGREQLYYIPIIITTARLNQMSFDPDSVEIMNGKIMNGKSQIDPIEFIRFKKNLATIIENESPEINSLRDLNRENDRTVFVVQAEKFITFLSRIDID